MTGPEHYREAERLAKIAGDYDGEPLTHHVQSGQLGILHATLALAATQVDGAAMRPAGRHEWLKATDPEYAAEQAAEVTP